jgi:Rieske Fe-S protein
MSTEISPEGSVASGSVVAETAQPEQPGAHLRPEEVSRRKFLFKLSVAVNGIVGAIFAVPILGYLLGPAMKKEKDTEFWVGLGPIAQFPEGETRLVNFRNPSTTPWDGQTGDIPAWVRRISGNNFQVFAINCAHLGCPVRWFAQSKLFMCPCHGGAYYQDGSRASGPPERGLFEYTYKIDGGNLIISVGDLPTLARPGTKQVAGCQGAPMPPAPPELVQIGEAFSPDSSSRKGEVS